VQSLGASLGLPLVLDADGACGLRVDDRLDVTLRLEGNPPALLVYAQAGVLPAMAAEAVLRRLLVANHVWEGSRGATWAVHDGQVVLSRLLPLEALEAEQLARELARFTDVACAEQDRLASCSEDPAAQLQPPLGMLRA
jgi:hypothetical protein